MIDMKSRTACFTGHRELPTDDLPEISKHLEDTLATLIEQGYRYFGAGGALGFDTLAAQAVFSLWCAIHRTSQSRFSVLQKNIGAVLGHHGSATFPIPQNSVT